MRRACPTEIVRRGLFLMYLADWLKMLARRWHFALSALLLVVFACMLTARAVPPEYQASATVLLIQPPPADIQDNNNPYLYFGTGLPVTANVLARALAGDEAQQAMADTGAVGVVEVPPAAPGAGGPLVTLVATSPTPRDAVRALDIGVAHLSEILANLQRNVGAPRQSWIRADLVSSTRSAEPVRQSQIRAVVMVAAVGVAVALLLLRLLDTRLLRIQRSRAATRRRVVVETSAGSYEDMSRELVSVGSGRHPRDAQSSGQERDPQPGT